MRALERTVRLRQRRQLALRDALEQREGVDDIRGRDGSPAGRLPLREECLEDLVQELPPFLRGHSGFLTTLFGQPKHVCGKVLERAFEVAFDTAHRVHTGLPRAGRSVVHPAGSGRSRRSNRKPLEGHAAQRGGGDRFLRDGFMLEDPGAVRRSQILNRQTSRFHFFEKRRRGHDRVVLEREGGDRDPDTSQPQQILKAGARGRETVGVGGPAKLGEQ